jgi:aminoglycoside phosphotransferase (APT) family kinase protein
VQPEQIDPALVDFPVLGRWMDDEGLPGGPFEQVEELGGGTQNVLIRFRRGGAEYVLRRGPRHLRAKSNEVLRREARVLAALNGTGVPAPRLLAACPDEQIMGGAVFYLMSLADGFNATVTLPEPHASDPALRHQMGLEAATALAALGAVDHLAAGLARWRATRDRRSRSWTGSPAGCRATSRPPGVRASCTATTTWPT